MEEITLHPSLFNTPLIYDEPGRVAMQEIYGQYRDIALRAGVPILLCAPTWRVDRERIARAGVPQTINRDAAAFMGGLRDRWDLPRAPVLVGGLLGPKNDCYQPSQGLSEKEALAFHEWQVLELAGIQSGQNILAVNLGLARRRLISHGCGAGQGYLFGRPVPSDELNVLLLYTPTLSPS